MRFQPTRLRLLKKIFITDESHSHRLLCIERVESKEVLIVFIGRTPLSHT
ncbi:unnamed protein product [Nesidiocoris tenuis]|uniref:Uncharacterized protein n=1 Tax=Nesidiocoris tenuis TaxID=355587 RepID=A0A6H5HBD9_9HEMI|nr:unnamed protein product [Nesidiocoris tenuis]